MKKKTRSVRIHSKEALPTDIFDVVETYTLDAMYVVRDVTGRRWRFPIADIQMVTETALVKA